MRRISAFLLALTLFLSALPLGARAEETELTQQTLTVATDPGLPDSDELFSLYTEQVLYGIQPVTFGISAGSRLSGDVKLLYDAMVPIIKQIAEGKRSSTAIGVGKTLTFGSTTFEADVKATFSGKSLSSGDLKKLLTALMSDLPYEMYWYDKTTGCSTEILAGSKLVYVRLKFSVAENYRSGSFRTDKTKTASVGQAAANAKRIVSCYSSASDYNKLIGYSDAICDLTAYNFSAASKGNYAENNDPWQLIHVFDGDPDTKVVCEGYAKAYQYLCDLSTFKGDVGCYSVTGTVNGGAHMWNIVDLEDKHYLLDVTNTDGGTYGDKLLLAGCTGSPEGNYQVSGLTYRYDSSTKNLWGTGSGSILKLSRSAYSPRVCPEHSYGSWDRFCSAGASRIGIKSRICETCGYMDTECTGTVDLEAPELKVSSVSATGKPRLTWSKAEGADVYRVYRATSKTGTYSRVKSTSGTSYTDSTAKAGKTYYYKVIAADTDSGKTSERSNIVSRMCDLARPSITVSVNSATGKPVVKWETVEGAAKYYIYRATEEKGTYTRVKSAVSARSYEDSTAEAGITYYYKVKAIHEKESANSDYSSVVSGVCDLAKPVITVTLTNDGAPRVTWETVDGAEKYYIYRSTSKSGTYTRIKSAVSARSFTDTAAEAGTRYYYKVKAVHSNTTANSAYSSAKSIVAG